MAILCVNCGSPARYYVDDYGANPLDFCGNHLPDHWRARAHAEQFQNSQAVDPQARVAADVSFGEGAVIQNEIAARFGVEPDLVLDPEPAFEIALVEAVTPFPQPDPIIEADPVIVVDKPPADAAPTGSSPDPAPPARRKS